MMATAALIFSALFTAARFALTLFAFLLSPSAILLCVFILLFIHVLENYRSFFPNEFQASDFHHIFGNTNSLDCLLDMINALHGSFVGSTSAGRSSQHTGRRAAASTGTSNNPSAPRVQRRRNQSLPVTSDLEVVPADFELMTILNMMKDSSASATEKRDATHNGNIINGTNNNPQNETNKTNKASRQENSATQNQKIHVHQEETETAMTVAMDISGFQTEEIKITVEKSTLLIRGERQNKIGDVFVFEESISLDDKQFSEDSIQASVSDNILEIRIGKKVSAQPRSISISKKEE
jgi:HSP20 family molecular chaperone IbpA